MEGGQPSGWTVRKSSEQLLRLLRQLPEQVSSPAAGGRWLLALEESIDQKLDWVRAFYVIRMQAEELMEKEPITAFLICVLSARVYASGYLITDVLNFLALTIVSRLDL